MVVIDIKDKIKTSLNDQDAEEALKYISEGLRADIRNSSLYYDMGTAYEINGDKNRAYLCFENALNYENSEEEKHKIIRKLAQFEIKDNISINKFSIIILTYNNLEYTKKCINSIKLNNRLDNYEIIIVDNASTDGTREWLKSETGIKCILNDENRGFPGGCNIGIEAAEKDNDIMLLNNDTIIMPNSIFNLRMALYSEDDIAICGSVSNNVAYFQNIIEKFNTEKEYYDYAARNNVPDSSRYDYRLKLVGFAMLISRGSLNKIGELDERFTPGNFEDDDLGLRMIKGGYKNILCRDSFIFHYGSISFKKEKTRFAEILSINGGKFKDKWGFICHEATNINYNMLNLLKSKKDDNIKVLEIGCRCGANLLEAKNKFGNIDVYGIESNKDCYEVAQNVGNVKYCSIDSENLDYEDGFFDYILLSKALDKCYDPLKLLNTVKKKLKKDGYILVTVANVMNFNVINNLINCSWNYTTGGLLDYESIRFFTLKEVYSLLNDAGYTEINSVASLLGITLEDRKFIEAMVSFSKTPGLAVHFQANEYYIRAKKID